MKRNSLKIVCNPYTNQISYYFKNEIGEWNVLCASSPLSRQFYTKTSMKERSKVILEKADEIYNRKNKGLDILYEGPSKGFKYLEETAKYFLPNRDIKCELGTTKIAVVGKKSVGKSCLIEGMEELQHYKYTKIKENGYTVYNDECNHAKWYEIDGIDLGKNNVDKAFRTIEELSKQGLSSVVYCISAISGRIEDVEKDLIMKIISEYCEIKVMIVLTMCYKEDVQQAIDEIKRITDQIKIVQTLAKEYKTGVKDSATGNPLVIKTFGLEMVSRYVFEGR